MKVLFVDFYCNCWGHKVLNKNLIKYLSVFAEIDVLSQKNWYDELPAKVRVIEMKEELFKTGRFYSRLNSLKIQYRAMKLDNRNHYDVIYIASYETLSLAVGRMFFKNSERIYITHHNNLDGLKKEITKKAFLSYALKVHHLVFEEFIKSNLIKEFNISEDRIDVIPHPLHINALNHNEKTYDCVGISNSNNEELIRELIDLEERYGIFKANNWKVILRSKNRTFDNSNLKIITGYLDYEDYEKYSNNTKSILIPFPTTFNNRVSSTMYYSLANKIKVIGSCIPVMEINEKLYPHICKVFNNSNDIIQYLKSFENDQSEKLLEDQEFQDFFTKHSAETITNKLKEIFEMPKSK